MHALFEIGFAAFIANSLFIDDADTRPVTAWNSLGEVDGLIFFHRLSASATIGASFGRLFPAFGAEAKRDGFIAMRALHLFLLGM
jgi:hypothetical protein